MGLVLKSISFTTNGNSRLGSIYCRKDLDTPIDPIAKLDNDKIHSVGVFVSDKLEIAFEISIEIENTENYDINAAIKCTEESEQALFGIVEFPGQIFKSRVTTRVSADVMAYNFKRVERKIYFFQQNLKWTYKIIGATSYELAETTADIYIIPTLPTEPWDSKIQEYSKYRTNYIWTSLLDVCREIYDGREKNYSHYLNTNEKYIAIFTDELNENIAFCYDVRNGSSYYKADTYTIKLQKYINDRARFVKNKLNCYDCAGLIQIECSVYGIKAYNAIMRGPNPDNTFFATNPIIAIGYKDWKVPFSDRGMPGGFAVHVVSTIDTTDPQNPKIWDACLKLDMGGTPWLVPSSDADLERKIPIIPGGLKFAETIADEVNVPTNCEYKFDFYRERLVCHKQKCKITKSFLITDIDTAKALQNKATLKNNEWAENVKKRFDLEKNPLPTLVTESEQKKQEHLSDFLLENGCRLTEDYGRNQVYEWSYDDAVFRVEFIVSLDEEEAYIHLLNLLGCIVNPNVIPANVGDISFRIDDTFYLFVKNNVVLKVSNETEESDTSAENIAHIICNSL